MKWRIISTNKEKSINVKKQLYNTKRNLINLQPTYQAVNIEPGTNVLWFIESRFYNIWVANRLIIDF